MQSYYLIPGMPILSVTIAVLLSMVFLYLAREPMHGAIKSLADGVVGGLNKLEQWSERISSIMQANNKKVLLESGIADAEHKLLEDFRRIETASAKYLADYPKIHLKLDSNVNKMDADYRQCGQALLSPPEWGEAIEAIANIKESQKDRFIEKMLSEIHKSAVQGEKRALAELRLSSAKRHKILSGLMPIQKQIAKLMKNVNRKVEQVIETVSRIDKHVEQYQKIRKGGSDSIEMLSSKTTKLFFFSLIVIGVAIFGAFINFQLIALPMSELVPAGTRVAGISVSEISAMVIVALEVVLGVFLLESLGVTNIFPQIAGLSQKRRAILLYGSLFGLFFLASVEASLAVLREYLAESTASVNLALSGDLAGIANPGGSNIAVTGQAILGFMLPWILSMVAVPLEMFIEASQHVFTKMASMLVRLFGYVAGMLAHVTEHVLNIIQHLYDAYIVIPSQIANMIKSRQSS